MATIKKKIDSVIGLIHFFLTKKKNHSENYCYYKTLALYNFFKSFDNTADYKINIVIETIDGKWGHAWLTRNNKPFPNEKLIPMKLEKIGNNSLYQYWIRYKEKYG